MRYFFVALLYALVPSSLLWASDDNELFIDFDQQEPKIKKSHWIFYLHADAIQLRPLTQYQMSHKQINTRDELYVGGGFGIARRFAIAFPLSTITEVNAYLWNNDETEVQKPSATDLQDYEVLKSHEIDRIYGIQISQSLNYAIETKYVLIEPFIQAGIGLARMDNKLDYYWDTNIASEYESYHSSISEDLATHYYAAGIQFIGWNGFLSYLKVQKNVFTIGTRKSKSSKIEANTAEVSSNTREKINSNQDEISYGLGFGYVF